jgi:ubiquinone/menaquinone biosynthesis C-methylase UbiE
MELMMKQFATIVLAGILCAGMAAAGAEEWAKIFENPDRHDWQNPSLVISMMGPEKGQKAAAIGTGSGLFVRWLSNKVGEKGAVYFVSADKGAVQYLRDLDGMSRYDNIISFLAAPEELALPEGQLDHLLLVNTLHAIPKRAAYYKKLAQALKPTGRLTVIDWQLGEVEIAPPEESRLGRQRVVEELAKAKWSLVTESVALRYQYLLVFHPPGAK